VARSAVKAAWHPGQRRGSLIGIRGKAQDPGISIRNQDSAMARAPPELMTEKWKLVTGDWRLATGDWRLETENCILV
jgi:hypothetical protein